MTRVFSEDAGTKGWGAPTSVSELRSSFGSTNVLRKFAPDFVNIASPLYSLLSKAVTWRWSKTEPDAFANIKVVLCSDSIVRHYDPNVLVLQCHVSSVGVGAALLYPGPDCTSQSVA